MAVLFPPMIENILPAFSSSMKIPFTLGMGVNDGDFSGVSVKINNTYTQKSMGTLEINKDNLIQISDGKYQIVIDNFGGIQLENGLYYGVRIALKNSDGVGYYSKVGTIKKIQAPELLIEVSDDFQKYVGECKFFNDEKVLSYTFNLYEGDNIIETSGELIHNNSINDGPDLVRNIWESGISFSQGLDYTIEYNIKTVNGFEASVNATINYQDVGAPNLSRVELKVEFNSDEGYNKIMLVENGLSTNSKKTLSGNFMLVRASSKDNYSTWEKLINFNLNKQKIYKWQKNIYKDYYLESGVTYRYAIQAYGKNSSGEFFYSSKAYNSNSEVENYFEDCFLSDGERQLKIRFNPKVSSFKNTILENKVDTIGGQYPYFNRNGNVRYKEFQISGLISLVADENDEFKSGLSIFDSTTISKTSLEGENFRKEREFKNQVLDWLTDGKPKLFKSAAEGTFIVRLMNVSLSPMDTLGRMLHTFSCTAYEMAEYNFNNLRKYNFLDKSNLITTEEMVVNISSSKKTITFNGVTSLTVYGEPNIKFKYFQSNTDSGTEKTIPYSGKYVFSNEFLKINPIKKIQFVSTITSSNNVYVIYTDSMKTSLVETRIVSLEETEQEKVEIVGQGIIKMENNKEVLDLSRNLLTKTEENIEDNKKEVVEQYGHYGKILPKELVEVQKVEDVYYINDKEVTSWSSDKVYKIIGEESYYIPKTSSTTPNFFSSLPKILEIFSIHNGNRFLIDRLEQGEVYIIKDFNNLYLGEGLKATLYLSTFTTTHKNPEDGEEDDIYAL